MTQAASVPLGAAPVALALVLACTGASKARAADHDSGSCFHGRKVYWTRSVRELGRMLTELVSTSTLPCACHLSLFGELTVELLLLTQTNFNFQSLLLHVAGVRGANAFAVNEHPHPSRLDCRHSLTSLL